MRVLIQTNLAHEIENCAHTDPSVYSGIFNWINKVVPVPSGYTKAQCAIAVAPEDTHEGNAYLADFTDFSAPWASWNDNRWMGYQNLVDDSVADPNNWTLRCTHGHSLIWGNDYPDYWSPYAACRYIVICG